MVAVGPRVMSTLATSPARIHHAVRAVALRWKFWRAPSMSMLTRPKSCRPRMLMATPGSRRVVGAHPGMVAISR